MYGDELPELDSPTWVRYDDRPGWGTIEFMRNIHKFYKTFSSHVIHFLEHILPHTQFDVNRVHLIRTTGDVYPHVDEIRKCCINIGLFNTSKSTVHYSKDKFTGLTAVDGEAYLLDTTKRHFVIAHSNEPRIMATYGFIRDYNTIKHEYDERFL